MSRRVPRADPYEVFALPLQDRWLVFAPGTWSAALMNHSALGALAECLEPDHRAPSLEALELFQALTIAAPDARHVRADASPKLVIMPTRACNIACVHCDFGAADAPLTVLDPRVAYPLIDRVAASLGRARGGDRTLRVHFFGGEPVVALRSLQAIVAHARAAARRHGMRARFELTTNGVCGEAARRFLGEEIDTVVVSLDGDEATHDAMRPRRDGRGTFAEVAETIRVLRRYPIELCLRTCVTDRSVEAVPMLAERFSAEFSPDAIAFEPLAETDGARAAGLHAPDPYAFARGFMAAEAIAAEHEVRVVSGPAELVGPRATSCPLGTGSLMLWPDGAITACYLDPGRWRSRGLELSLGRVDASGAVRVNSERLARIASSLADTPRCARCFCRYTCAGGCHVEQTPPGCAPEYDDRCVATRLITACRLMVTIGVGSEAADMLFSASAAEALALHADDRLRSWAKVL